MSSKRTPSNSERALFRSSVGEVRRLRDDRVSPTRAIRRAAPRGWVKDTHPVDMMPDGTFDAAPGPGDRQLFSNGGVQHRVLRRLARGRLNIEAGLDLHGMSVERARAALSQFLEDCAQRGVRRVRIVHGKGFGSRDSRPVLKAQVDRWLRLRSDVVAFCSAPCHDGGTGAVYVLLRQRSID